MVQICIIMVGLLEIMTWDKEIEGCVGFSTDFPLLYLTTLAGNLSLHDVYNCSRPFYRKLPRDGLRLGELPDGRGQVHHPRCRCHRQQDPSGSNSNVPR